MIRLPNSSKLFLKHPSYSALFVFIHRWEVLSRSLESSCSSPLARR